MRFRLYVSLPLPGRSALHLPQMIRSVGQRATASVLRPPDVCMSGLTHANNSAVQVPAEKFRPPPGDPHPLGTPPFRRMGPTDPYELESARPMGVPAQLTVGASLKAGCRQALNRQATPRQDGGGRMLTTLGHFRRALSAEAIGFCGAVAQVSAGPATVSPTQEVGDITWVIPTLPTHSDQLTFS